MRSLTAAKYTTGMILSFFLSLLLQVLQNLANHVLFRKEAHMKVFNDFLEENFEDSRQLALDMASMGPYIEGEAGEYIAFLKESYKHRIHSLLWNNQEKITAYTASIRWALEECVCVCVCVWLRPLGGRRGLWVGCVCIHGCCKLLISQNSLLLIF